MKISRKTDTTKETKEKNMNFGIFDKLKYYSITILFLVVSGAMIFFIAIPEYKKIAENKEKISKNEAKLNTVRVQAEYLLSLEKMKDELKLNEELAKRALPEVDMIPEMFNQLIQISDNSFIELEQLSFGGVSENDVNGYSEVSAQISVNGKLDQVITYLTNLEESLRIFTIDNVNVSYEDSTKNNTPTTGSSNVGLSFTLNSYFMPPVDGENVSIEQIMQKPRLEGVIQALDNKIYYEPEAYNLELGKTNPFLESLPETIKKKNTTGGITPVPAETTTPTLP